MTRAAREVAQAVENEQRAKRFGAAMARARQRKNLSQTALGDAIGSNQSTISSWERGEAEPPPDFVFAIERACGESGGALSRFFGYLPVTEETVSLIERTLDAYRRDLLDYLSERFNVDSPSTVSTPRDPETGSSESESESPEQPRPPPKREGRDPPLRRSAARKFHGLAARISWLRREEVLGSSPENLRGRISRPTGNDQ